MPDLDELFSMLTRSPFRRRFRLGPKDQACLAQKTLAVILEHGRKFLQERLAPAEPQNDGRQTPMRGHPIFVAQHATATCCRGCLEKWHHIPRGRELSEQEIDYVLAVISRWLNGQMGRADNLGLQPHPNPPPEGEGTDACVR
jgi:hypothetical protein